MQNYIVRKSLTGYQVRERVLKLEKTYGVHFDAYTVGDGVRFIPVIRKDTPVDRTYADELMKHMNAQKDFTTLATLTNLSIEAVLSAANWLIKNHIVSVEVDRMGNAAAIKPLTPAKS